MLFRFGNDCLFEPLFLQGWDAGPRVFLSSCKLQQPLPLSLSLVRALSWPPIAPYCRAFEALLRYNKSVGERVINFEWGSMSPLVVPEMVKHLTAKPCERAVKGWSVSHLVELILLRAFDETFYGQE